MTELIFGYKKIFGSGHFLIFFQISWIKKMPRAKKVVYLKNQFFHARQPREGIFDIHSHQCCIFIAYMSELQIAPIIPMLGINVPNLVQGHLRTCYLLICVRQHELWRSGLC